MRLATYKTARRIEVGVVARDGATVTPFDLPPEQAARGLLALLDAGPSLRPLRNVEHRIGAVATELLAPIPQPRRNILCVGKNYREHVEEIATQGYDTTGGGTLAPTAPIVFSKLPDTVIGHGAPIVRDASVTRELDYEAELGVIIGRGGRAIRRHDALQHVWGYTIINDVTARDLQRRHKQWLLGKSQDSFCPMGPFAVTRDMLDLDDTPLRCWVNGELRQDSNTAYMMFDVAELITVISAGITLYAGDIIATGTPAGVGAGFSPPRFLAPGDTVRIEIPPIGVLENRVDARRPA